jgi:hypothetical protein
MVMIVATLEGMVNKLVSKVLNLEKKMGMSLGATLDGCEELKRTRGYGERGSGIERGEQLEYRTKVHYERKKGEIQAGKSELRKSDHLHDIQRPKVVIA